MGFREGIYAASYVNQGREGAALLAFKRGTVAGADYSGACWDGTYGPTPDGAALDFAMRISFPARVTSTLTGSVQDMPHVEAFSVAVPVASFRDGLPVSVQTSLGKPMRIAFSYLRDLPF